MTTQTYTVTGMTCEHCVGAVSGELGRLAGVRDVRVDLASGAVTLGTIGADAVDSGKIVDGSVANGDIGDHAIRFTLGRGDAELPLPAARQLLLDHEHVHVDVRRVERRDGPLPDRRVEHGRHQAARHFRFLLRRSGTGTRGGE
jgi:copper chaperone CopZ